MQSTVWISFYERIFSNKFFSSSVWAYAGFAKGGQLFCVLATRGTSKRLLEGFGACFPEKNFWDAAIWCVLEYIFINFLPSKSLKIFIFYTKILIICSHVLARGSRSMIPRNNRSTWRYGHYAETFRHMPMPICLHI